MGYVIATQQPHPFTLAAFKRHLRLETSDDDTQVQLILDAAVTAVERWTGRVMSEAIIVQEEYDAPPFRAALGDIDQAVSLNVVHINLETGASTTVSDEFRVASLHGWQHLILKPREYHRRDGYYRWTYTAGPYKYDADVPKDLELCVYGIGATWYENREQVAQNINLSKLPIAYRSILETYRDGML